QSVTWQVGPAQAELSARVDLVAPDRDLSLVEWQVQSPRPVTIAGVTGPGVSRWSQSGDRLLVWLEKTAGSARLELSGWVPLAPTAGGKKPGVPARLDLPCLRLARPAGVRAHLTLTAAPGLELAARSLRQLAADGTPRPGELRYV